MPFNSDGLEVKISIYVMLIVGPILLLFLMYMTGKFIVDELSGTKNTTNSTNNKNDSTNTTNNSTDTSDKSNVDTDKNQDEDND